MVPENRSLEGLSDELLLEILLHLSTIRSSETNLAAFRQKEKEMARQRENCLRQLSLYSLCLTSSHLNRLAIPALYAAFTGSTTWHSIGLLRRFHETITKPRGSLDKDSAYARHLQYVETRFADYLGNSLFTALEDPSGPNMMEEYFSLLADIINSAPNLQHISVTSVETSNVSFWKHVLRKQNTGTPCFTVVAGHGLSRLKTLCVQTDLDEDGEVREASFDSICSAMASLPSLSDFRASRVRVNELVGPKVNIGQFRNLQRLEITECLMDFRSMRIIISACEGLRHIVCQWEYLDCTGQTIADFRPGLLKHSHTLETLFLDFREVRWTSSSNANPGHIGSLRQFEHLHTLTITEKYFLTGLEYGPSGHYLTTTSKVTEMLPLSLKRLNLFVEVCDSAAFVNTLDDLESLWALSEACGSSFRNLSKITVIGTGPIYGIETLMSAFEQVGVLFEFIID